MKQQISILLISGLFLCGCEATYQLGIGYELRDTEKDFRDIDTGKLLGKVETWSNPTGIVGVSYPLMDNLILDYRHISSLGGRDNVTSDNLSLLIQFKGSEVAGK